MLAARIWLPDDAELNPVPAILEYLPYRKRDGTYERDALTHPYLAGHGYAGVRVDIRGSGESDGLLFDEYAKQEQDDGLEVIEWLAAQSWCSGVVGMMGISWGGFNGLQIAARRPPALKAIVTICSTDDRYADDAHYMGGALLTAGLEWASFFFGSMCLPPDPSLVGDRWRAMWVERLENVPLFFETWLRHQRRDDYWKHGSVCEDYAAIQCPVYAVGGWTDGYKNAIPRLLEQLSVPRRGLIGPWACGYPHFALPGPQIGFLQVMLRWWDYWLKGIDTDVMDDPMLRAWMTESVKPARHHGELPGRWVAESSWPSPGVISRRLFLTDEGLRTEAAALTPRPICSPQTVGKCSGDWVPFGHGSDQAGDQQEDDMRSLVFETPQLHAPIEILGAATVTLDIASDRPIANLAVRLCDVHPSGKSMRVSYGLLNLTHRDGHEAPAPLVTGERYTVCVKLNDAGSVFPVGHRIRLALSTAYWPIMWPSPEKATLSILGGTIDLPERPPQAADARLSPLPGPESALPEKPTIIHRNGMRIERIDRIGLELGVGGKSLFHVADDDPLSALVDLQRTQTMSRGTWQIRTETQMRLSCTRNAFHLRGSLRAFEGVNKICSREWDRAIPRDFL
ncbi:CocE/NonD family hydrolase [Nordella sp. HKS 07]|nr:CocE/NonD family hydrolase [Nordella sp. HKS 07]